MTETLQLVDDSTTAWPERYNVRAEVTYRDRRGNHSRMQVIAFQRDMTREQADELLAALGFNPAMKGYHYLVSQAKDTFSLEEADALVNYLNSRKGTLARMQPARLPSENTMGASAIPTLPSFKDGAIYRYHTEPGYPLKFRVESINMRIYLYMARLAREFQGLDNDEKAGELGN